MARPKALFVQSLLTPHGGGHAVAAWMLEALQPSYDVSILTWRAVEFERINQIFGTDLRADSFRWLLPSPAAKRLVEAIPDNSDLQKLVWLMRMCKRIHSEYDALLTADCEVDFGRPGIQYLHYPHLAPHDRRLRQYGNREGWRMIPALALRVYRPWMALGEFSFARVRQNLTLANSNWTARRYQDCYQTRAETLYPPAPGTFRHSPWEIRGDEFVCISRLERTKNHLRIMEILRRVRERHPQIRLRIIGTRGTNRAARAYYRVLREAVQQSAEWVRLEEDASRAALEQFLARARFGIHLLEDEHFGMAVAEMARGGVIPFVHDSGGQAEIVERRELRFSDDNEAVARILAVLDAPHRQRELQRELLFSADRFRPERFCSELLRWTDLWASRQRAAA